MIIGISGKIGSGKDTVGKIIQIITQSPHFTNRAVEKFLDKDILQPSFLIKKFADKLKNNVCELIGCTREQLEDQKFKETELGPEWWYWELKREGGYSTIMIPYPASEKELMQYEGLKLIKPTPRLFLQLIGTEGGRDLIHPQVWVNSLFSDYKYLGDKTEGNITANIRKDFPNWIITDMRFPNELEAVKNRAGITIRINGRVLCKDINGNKHSLTQKEWSNIKQSEENKGWVFTEEHTSETGLDNTTHNYIIDNYGTIEDLIIKVREILILEKII